MKCRDSKQKASIRILSTPTQAGEVAAADVAKELRSRLAIQPIVRMIFAAAPSQAELLHALGRAERIDWQRVEAFQMDEYIGLPADAPQRFSSWLTRELSVGSLSVGRICLTLESILKQRQRRTQNSSLGHQSTSFVLGSV